MISQTSWQWAGMSSSGGLRQVGWRWPAGKAEQGAGVQRSRRHSRRSRRVTHVRKVPPVAQFCGLP